MMKTIGGSMMKRIKKMGIVVLFLLMAIATNSNAVTPSDYGMDYDYFVNIAETQAIAGEKTFEDEITFEKYTTFDASVTITGVLYSTAVYSQNADLLDGHDSLYFAVGAGLTSEIATRISEDDLIGAATGQIRIDFAAYDSTLNTSTTTLRTDLVSEIANRISEDDLIGAATDQIRTDFEAYDATLNTSTTTLRSDLTLEIAMRVNEISSLTTTYLGLTATADDSDLLEGNNAAYFVDTVTAQNIGGIKTFDDNVIFDGNITLSGGFHPKEVGTLPSSGYIAGDYVQYTGGSSYELYVATEAVASADSWVKVGSQ